MSGRSLSSPQVWNVMLPQMAKKNKEWVDVLLFGDWNLALLVIAMGKELIFRGWTPQINALQIDIPQCQVCPSATFQCRLVHQEKCYNIPASFIYDVFKKFSS